MLLGPLRFPLAFHCALRRLHRLDVGDGNLKLFNDPGIEAFAGNACREIDLAMKLRRNAGDELARKWFVRLLATLLAEREVIVNRFLEGRLQFGNGFALEGDNVPRVENLAVEDSRLVVEFNFANIAFVFHHGITPASIRNRRMERTAPLSVSFCGCGR